MPHHVVVCGDQTQGEEAALRWLSATRGVQRRLGSELDPETIFDDLAQPGMFTEERSLLYSDVLALKLDKRETERVARLLAQLPATTRLACVQLVQEESKSKEVSRLKSPTLRLFMHGANLEDLRSLARLPAAARWLLERAHRLHQLTLTSQQAEMLLRHNQESPSLAAAQLESLALLKPDEAAWQVSDEAVTSLLTNAPLTRFYALSDAMLDQPPDTLRMLREWFALDPAGFRLIGELKRRLLQVRTVIRGEQVYPPFAARGAQSLARRLSGPRLARALQALAQTEYRLKSGLIPGESSRQMELTALEFLAAELARNLRS